METPLASFKPSEKRRREAADMGTPLETINIREFIKSRGSKEVEPGTSQGDDRVSARNEALESETRGRERRLASERFTSQSMAHLVARKEVAEVERLLDEELSILGRLESEKDALTKRLSVAEEELRASKASSRLSEAEHRKQIEEWRLRVAEAQQRVHVAQAECDHKCVNVSLEARLERKRREADQAVLEATQAQLEDKIKEAAEGDRKLQQCQLEVLALRARSKEQPLPTGGHGSTTPPGSTTGLLAERVRQLEEALTRQELLSSRAQWTTRDSFGGGATPQGSPKGPEVQDSELLRSSSEALDAARSGLHAWQQVLSGALASAAASLPSIDITPSSLTPEDAALAIQKILVRNNELRELVVERDARLLEISAMHREAEGRAGSLECRLWESSAALQSVVIGEKTARCRMEAVERERDGLRRALAPLPPSPIPSPGADKGKCLHSPGTVSEHLHLVQQAARADELQGLVEDLQSRLARAQEEASVAGGSAVRQRVECEASEARARAAEGKAAQLEREANGLALDVSALQEKLGRGEVNGSSIRVLHLKMNPEAQHERERVERELAETRAENEALRAQLGQLAREVEASRGGRESREALEDPSMDHQGAGDHGAGDSDLGSSSVHALAVRDAQVAVLQHRLGELEKTMIRLKEVTKERIAAFREACYCLFGFRVDMTSEATTVKEAQGATSTFSLRPQHADDPGTVLVFRYTKARGMELVPNAHSLRMKREVGTFVDKFKSIPAFTANLTMESFQKQTAC